MRFLRGTDMKALNAFDDWWHDCENDRRNTQRTRTTRRTPSTIGEGSYDRARPQRTHMKTRRRSSGAASQDGYHLTPGTIQGRATTRDSHVNQTGTRTTRRAHTASCRMPDADLAGSEGDYALLIKDAHHRGRPYPHHPDSARSAENTRVDLRNTALRQQHLAGTRRRHRRTSRATSQDDYRRTPSTTETAPTPRPRRQQHIAGTRRRQMQTSSATSQDDDHRPPRTLETAPAGQDRSYRTPGTHMRVRQQAPPQRQGSTARPRQRHHNAFTRRRLENIKGSLPGRRPPNADDAGDRAQRHTPRQYARDAHDEDIADAATSARDAHIDDLEHDDTRVQNPDYGAALPPFHARDAHDSLGQRYTRRGPSRATSQGGRFLMPGTHQGKAPAPLR